jgi:hypothetical protein
MAGSAQGQRSRAKCLQLLQGVHDVWPDMYLSHNAGCGVGHLAPKGRVGVQQPHLRGLDIEHTADQWLSNTALVQ